MAGKIKKGKGKRRDEVPALVRDAADTGTKKRKRAAKIAQATAAELSRPPRHAPESPTEPTRVDIWVDPICPWAWLTSRWLLEVETVRAVTTVFHVMSLAVLDEINGVPYERRRTLEAGWAPVRVALGVQRHYGQEQLATFYSALGTRFHPGGEPRSIPTVAAALSDVGLPPDMIELAYTGDYDHELRASHRAGMDPVGYNVGTPVIHVGGVAWFGPVLTPRPSGEAAGEVYDAVLRLATFPGFYELKRTRTTGPLFVTP